MLGQDRVKCQNAVFSRLGDWGRRNQLILTPTRPKYSQRCDEDTAWVWSSYYNKDQGQGQAIKGYDNQRFGLPTSVVQILTHITCGASSWYLSAFWR